MAWRASLVDIEDPSCRGARAAVVVAGMLLIGEEQRTDGLRRKLRQQLSDSYDLSL